MNQPLTPGMAYARVHIADAPLHIDRAYTYAIPHGCPVRAGALVYVPFGSRRVRGIVTGLYEPSPEELAGMNIREIESIVSEELVLDGDLLGLCRFLCEQTFCTVGEAARTLLPSAAFGTVREERGHYIETVRPALPDEQLRSEFPKMRSEKQRQLLDLLLAGGEMTVDQLKNTIPDVREAIRALVKKGWITVEKSDCYRDPYAGKPAEKTDANILSPQQQQAYITLETLYASGKPNGALLHGITGSGKTRVIKAMADRVIADGRGVIMMIPEISLTPQMVSYFRACYGDRIAVMHSSLSAGERLDMWRRIRRGEVDICVGTRSAVFAPFPNIGMIVIDEEQEHTYKSDMDPKYHARDVARYRCAAHNALMLLASATPSLESYHKAQTGIYTLVELTQRYGNARLPQVEIADLRQDARDGNVSAVGTVLRARLSETIYSGKQAVLFLNRRGYNSALTCPSCGQTIMCPNCSVAMTYHHTSDKGKAGYLACHWCGYRRTLPESCPGCGAEHMKFTGMGTQRAEEELQTLYPDARILRMDADTTGSKFSYDEMLTEFRHRKADILLGTQMVTKGHDFPGVTLSAVLSADSSLYVDDFRAGERTFSMICQLLGRSGRAEEGGKAIIQTYNPDHPLIAMAAAQDYSAFYRNEISLRRALEFPPFCDMALITLTAENEAEVNGAAVKLNTFIRQTLQSKFPDVYIKVFGPFEAPVYRVNSKYRMRFVMKCKNNKRTRAFLRKILLQSGSGEYKKTTITLDINPNN